MRLSCVKAPEGVLVVFALTPAIHSSWCRNGRPLVGFVKVRLHSHVWWRLDPGACWEASGACRRGVQLVLMESYPSRQCFQICQCVWLSWLKGEPARPGEATCLRHTLQAAYVSETCGCERREHCILFFLFKNIFIDYAITVVRFCPPLFPSALHTPSHPHFPPLLSSCPWVIHIRSLASTFPILFLISPGLFCTYYLCFLFPVLFSPFSPFPSPLITPHVISISVILFLF